MPKVIAEVPLTKQEVAIILISLELRQRHFSAFPPPASRTDAARLESLIKEFEGYAKLKG